MKHVMKLLVAIGLFATVPIAYSSNEKPSSYELDIEFTPQSSSLTGEAVVEFLPVMTAGTKTFYLHGELEVESITLDEKGIDFKTQPVFYESNYSLIANELTFEVEEDSINAKLRIVYHGQFNPSSARSASDYMRLDDDGVFLRSYGYSLWFPVFLESSQDVYSTDFARVSFKIPKRYSLVFIGDKTSEEVVDEHAISS